MKVTTGHNPYAYQQQNSRTKPSEFAELYASIAANKSGEAEVKLATDPAVEDAVSVKSIDSVEPAIAKEAELESTSWPDDRFLSWPNARGYVPKNPQSIYNLSPAELEAELDAARAACSHLNMEGLTKAEIYNRIESVYKEYLGKDFLEPLIILGGSWGINPYKTNLESAHHQFDSQLSKYGVRDTETLIEARGYAGMSESEIRAAVRTKYPKSMTLKDCILMAQELQDLEVEKTNIVSAIKDRFFTAMGAAWTPQSQRVMNRVYEVMLGLPADYGTIKNSYAAFEQSGYSFSMPQNIDELFGGLLSWFGGNQLYSKDMVDEILELLKEISFDHNSNKT